MDLVCWVVHNCVAHPLLVLCPPVGRFLHAATVPSEPEPARPAVTALTAQWASEQPPWPGGPRS